MTAMLHKPSLIDKLALYPLHLLCHRPKIHNPTAKTISVATIHSAIILISCFIIVIIKSKTLITLQSFRFFVLADFFQRFGFNLPDAFSGYSEFFADFFQGMDYAVAQAESHLKNFLLFRR